MGWSFRALFFASVLCCAHAGAGLPFDPGLAVMSGYRTPFYNRAIGNVRYSRHVYGDGADVFVDSSPQDDLMDDLDGNGKIDVRDAEVLYEIVEGIEKSNEPDLAGGLAAYAATSAHGPFVHIDVRGYRARW